MSQSSFKIFLDDVRDAPDSSWLVIRTPQEFVEKVTTIYSHGNSISHISFDHDLGENLPTGYDLLKWHLDWALSKNNKFAIITIHSQNPVGRDNMIGLLDFYRKYFPERFI